MRQYKVKITNKALHDMESIYEYIAHNLLSTDNAMKQYDRIAKAIETLKTFPERCRRLEIESEPKTGMRRLLVDNYSVVFTIENEAVVVLRVLYSASDIITRLEENN